MKTIRISLLFFVTVSVFGADFQAGIAKLKITPEGPIWLSGYASRERPSEGVLQELYVRALALEDPAGLRIVVATADLVGIPRAMADEVCARIAKKYDLDRRQILLNASHTHTGPVVWPNLKTMYDLPDVEVEKLKRYSRRVTDSLVTVIGASLDDLTPAVMAHGAGEVGFAINRRVLGPEGWTGFGVTPNAPVDHTVPVIRITAPDGALRAILFGYACHNTTLTGQHYRISGDYSGYAQSELEKDGQVALFFALCGGDQNPEPRTRVTNVEAHGRSLAVEVKRVLNGQLKPIAPPLQAAFQLVDLKFRYHTREQFEQELNDENPSKVRRAKEMLAAYDDRHPVRSIPYPVHAVRFGKALTLLALGGEVVVDYSLRAKREYAGQDLIVAGYSNDVMCYIPSLRVLREGGYEADSSMIYYGMPGPFDDDVEETVFRTVHQVMQRVGVKPTE
jgi:neutral/alkaline ceramidase-like enzyme